MVQSRDKDALLTSAEIGPSQAEVPQYAGLAVFAIWAAAALPMATLVWLMAPARAERLKGEGNLPIVKGLLLHHCRADLAVHSKVRKVVTSAPSPNLTSARPSCRGTGAGSESWSTAPRAWCSPSSSSSPFSSSNERKSSEKFVE